jgi:hypothetical protein
MATDTIIAGVWVGRASSGGLYTSHSHPPQGYPLPTRGQGTGHKCYPPAVMRRGALHGAGLVWIAHIEVVMGSLLKATSPHPMAPRRGQVGLCSAGPVTACTDQGMQQHLLLYRPLQHLHVAVCAGHALPAHLATGAMRPTRGGDRGAILIGTGEEGV